jgi:hypothetical protein
MVLWLQPTLLNDGAWHGFIGYQDGTRSPSLWVNFNGCDVGFCDCSGATGGIAAWDCLACAEGDAGCTCTTAEGETTCALDEGATPLLECGVNNWVTPVPTTDMPDGICNPRNDLTQACRSAGCCDCSTANTGNAGDGVSGNGMHWDTRTTQAANGNTHGGQRFAGVADNYFVSGEYTHVVWTKAGQECNFYKNGALTDTTVCPTHVDLHANYEIGHVDNFFQGVIDEVSLFQFALSEHDALAIYSMTATATPPGAYFLFDGTADDAAGYRHGTVSGAKLTSDRFGTPNQAYSFDGDDLITVETPFTGADDDFTISIWLQPTLLNDGAWHGFLGYQDGTRSPSLWVNFNGCDVGFCDCSGATGGIAAWEGGDGPNGWVTPEPTFDRPDGDCDVTAPPSCTAGPDDPGVCGVTAEGGACEVTATPLGTVTEDTTCTYDAGGVVPKVTAQACASAGCCDCSTANTGNSGDGVSGNGMHWDTRTTQDNGNAHAGQRFAGVADDYFVFGQYTGVVWTKAGQECNLYKNGALTDTTTCPTHVDLHDTYEIGHVDNFFNGVIDEVAFYTMALSDAEIATSIGRSAPRRHASAGLVRCYPGRGVLEKNTKKNRITGNPSG